MKKITVIGMIKNAADIIESFIRCNAVWADQFVLLDNMSTDRTREILEALIDEGFNIEIIEDKDEAYHQSEKMNKLLRYAIDKYETDYVIALDDDEILISERTDMTVKDMFECLLDEDLYYIGWKNYIPTEDDDQNDICVPHRMRFRLDDQLGIVKKIIIPAAIVDDSFNIAQGNHFANGDLIKNHVNIVELRIAHFPIRSEEQIKSKALIGWTNYLIMEDREESLGLHWKAYYDIVKAGKKIPIEVMQLMVLRGYFYSMEEDKINVICNPVELPQECFELKYTSGDEINAIKNYINHVEKIICNM